MKHLFVHGTPSITAACWTIVALILGCLGKGHPDRILLTLDSDAGLALVAGPGFNDLAYDGSFRHDEAGYLGVVGALLPYTRFLDTAVLAGVGKPVVVVNPYSATPQESAAWVADVSARGNQVYGWELGNELYMQAYADVFGTIGDFITTAPRIVAWSWNSPARAQQDSALS